MAIVILTKSPQFTLNDTLRSIKRGVKFLLMQKRGQDLVTVSLRKGLEELGIPYKYNVHSHGFNKDDVVYVNGSLDALKWAIRAKENGQIAKLLVGPVMVVSPEEQWGIMMDQAIDVILLPSEWVKAYWLSVVPALKEKIKIWTVGIDIPPESTAKKTKILVYAKNIQTPLYDDVIGFLQEKKDVYDVITYGRYTHQEYLSLLDTAKMMIYFSESESQGLALCESWMKNVPTLVWNRGFWSYKGFYWKDKKISAPYLNEQSGLFFNDKHSFVQGKNKILEFPNEFSPREYALQHFTHKEAAENFLSITG